MLAAPNNEVEVAAVLLVLAPKVKGFELDEFPGTCLVESPPKIDFDSDSLGFKAPVSFCTFVLELDGKVNGLGLTTEETPNAAWLDPPKVVEFKEVGPEETPNAGRLVAPTLKLGGPTEEGTKLILAKIPLELEVSALFPTEEGGTKLILANKPFELAVSETCGV